MKCIYTLALILVSSLLVSAQNNATKRYAKIHQDKKYIITETIFDDGHKEQYITSVPLSETRKMKVKGELPRLKNIDWDERMDVAGNQKSANGPLAIEKAFNNALTQTEKQLGLAEGSFGRIEIDVDFFNKGEQEQSLTIVNKVIASLSTVERFSSLLPLESVDKKISDNSKKIASSLLANGKSTNQTAAEMLGFRNVEFSEHFKNDAVFLTNSETEIGMPHIQAIYSWIFADAHTGWYNRGLLINSHKNNSSKGLNDDYMQEGKEGIIGVGIAQGAFIESVILDPTFEKATSVVFQMVDPLKNSKYKFEIQELSTNYETDVAARK